MMERLDGATVWDTFCSWCSRTLQEPPAANAAYANLPARLFCSYECFAFWCQDWAKAWCNRRRYEAIRQGQQIMRK
jgi:hypothetical protein